MRWSEVSVRVLTVAVVDDMGELDAVHREIGRLLDVHPSESWTLPQARSVLRVLAGFRAHPPARFCAVHHRVSR